MAVIFSKDLDRLNANDTAASISKLESHIRYMQETLDFSLRGMRITPASAYAERSAAAQDALWEEIRALRERVEALEAAAR